MKLLRQITCFLLTFGIVLNQEDNDEGRPYEFGFTIDGQQHRHEKKDQNGVVQGEFGFITADGVYHVTVYATDENGNFKILSMRNIRISPPLDGSPTIFPISQEAGKYQHKEKQTGLKSATVAVSQQSRQSQFSQQQSPQKESLLLQQTSEIVTQKPEPRIFTTLPTIKPACGGCGYVTTERVVPGQKFQFQNSAFQIAVNRYNQHSPPTGVQTIQKVKQEYIKSLSNAPNKYHSEMEMLLPSNQKAVNPINHNVQNADHMRIDKENFTYQQKIQYSQNIASENESITLSVGMNSFTSEINAQNQQDHQKFDTVSSSGLSEHNTPVNNVSQQQPMQHNFQRENVTDNQGIKSTGRNSMSGGAIGPNPLLTSKEEISQIPPISLSDNIIHVGGNKPIDIPIRDKYPGMVNGLPDGIKEKDIKDILYKFHYTVGFHGHYEKGLSNGAKIGGYFVNGRDGISRVVTYIADENGYRPKFKFINLGIGSSDTPKEENEKSFGLKNFEFIWYPIH